MDVTCCYLFSQPCDGAWGETGIWPTGKCPALGQCTGRAHESNALTWGNAWMIRGSKSQLLPMSPCYCPVNTYLLKSHPCVEQSLHLRAVQSHREKHFRYDLWEGYSLPMLANPRSHFQREVWARSEHWTSHLLLLPWTESSTGTSSLVSSGNTKVHVRQAPGQPLPCP